MLNGFPEPTITLEYASPPKTDLISLINRKEGYNPLNAPNIKPMNKSEQALYLSLMRGDNNTSITPSLINGLGFKMDDLDSLIQRGLVSKYYSNFYNIYHPHEAAVIHPSIVKQRKAETMKERQSLIDMANELKEVIDELGMTEFKRAIKRLAKERKNNK